MAARPDPVCDWAPGLARARSRVDPAGKVAQQNSRRLLWPAGTDPVALAGAGACVWPAGFFAALPRHTGAQGYFSAFLRRGPGALARRTLVGGFRPHADSNWRRLRPGQSPRDLAHFARTVS